MVKSQINIMYLMAVVLYANFIVLHLSTRFSQCKYFAKQAITFQLDAQFE